MQWLKKFKRVVTVWAQIRFWSGLRLALSFTSLSHILIMGARKYTLGLICPFCNTEKGVIRNLIGGSKIRTTHFFIWYSWMAFIHLDVVILTPLKSERTATLTVALHFDILFGYKIMTNITGNPCSTKIPSQSNDVKNRFFRFRSNLWSAMSPELSSPTCSHWDLNLVWKPGCWLSIPQIDLTKPAEGFRIRQINESVQIDLKSTVLCLTKNLFEV